VVKDIPTFTQATGVTTAFGPFTNNLANGGEHLVLRNHDNRLMDEMTYDDEQPWPEGADGSGTTLSKRTPLSASAEPIHWVSSPQLGGTPGHANFPDIIRPPWSSASWMRDQRAFFASSHRDDVPVTHQLRPH
jgi:hypothetical protein